ncbi:MAG: tRNA threonylcarbamoyladenosine dehydratase [Fusicatenibacter sp.]|nr:tRNA threonylcarbamoyladenosine dehydratase [Lachnospiraceae bacterium]MDY2938055.1 tRNA threonylcarbamoyladenosine dehydratase [Fusicatenibacter sp.]
MLHEYSRTELLIGREGLLRLRNAKVAVFGIGGVGSYVAEALARSGIGTLILVDSDTVSLTNLNRQLLALHSTIGRKKTDVMRERIQDIDPETHVLTYDVFYQEDTAEMFPMEEYDYVVDAIDTVSSKLLLIERAAEKKTPVISCMGTGNKLDPGRFEITDITKTSVCPLAKVMRRELKKRGITGCKVLYSREEPVKAAASDETKGTARRPVPGSISFVPGTAGLMIAGEVVRDLLKTASDSSVG